jgi:two-component system cell cycle sensor histidine kinase/response regulator CckA
MTKMFSMRDSRPELISLASRPTTAMNSTHATAIRHGSIPRAFGLLVILISGAALIGWFADSVILKGIRADYIPMAPNTALVFILLGAILTCFTTSKGFRVTARIAAIAMAVLAATRLSEYLTALELKVDHWFFRFPAEPLGVAPVGKMALCTAITFLVLSGAVFLSTVPKPRWINDLVKVLAVVVALIGLAFLLGYFYGAPLLYGGRSIPMAMNTAICFLISGTGLFVRASLRDVSERRAAKEALQSAHDELETRVKERTDELRAQEEFLRAIVDTSPNAIFVKDSQGRFTLVNAAVETAYGRSAAEIIGKTESDLNGYHEEIQTFIEDDAQVLRTLRPKYIPDEQLTNPRTGKTRSFQTMKVPLILPGTTKVHILGVATDISDRKQAEEAMRDSEERYRLLFESNPQSMWVYDRESLAFLAVNEAAIFHYGYSREEFLSMTIKEIRAEEHLPALFDKLSNETGGVKIAGNWKHRRKDGATIDVDIVSHPLLFDGREAKLVLVTDITERKLAEQALRETEAQLRQSQKLEGIGQLAGGIAHDFNNLLTVINGFTALAMKDLPPEDPTRDNLEEVKKAGDRATALTRQLLAFSRKQVLQPEVLNLDAVVTEMEKMLRRVIGENIDLRAVLEPKLGSVKADPGQIEQIIMNLVVNARDSMPAGGKVTIETDNVYLDEDYAKNHVEAQPGHYVMLAVSDTGTGMDEETQARIFEPFFTTKELGKGTGLGLSTIYGIVKQSGGNIWVYSEVGQGTTFKIYLPRVDEEAQQYKRAVITGQELHGAETILLVEDEEMVRKLAHQILANRGYLVLEAANGASAVLLCESHHGPIDLLLTDVIMPEMSGRELSERLHLLRPEMQVLFMSGYTDDAIVHHGVLEEGANFIQKPFAPEALAMKVRKVLESTRSTLDAIR